MGKDKIKWIVYIKLAPPIPVKTFKDLPSIKFLVKKENSINFIDGLKIITPKMFEKEVEEYAGELANRCADYISFQTNHYTSCFLSRIEGEVIKGTKQVSFSIPITGTIISNTTIDITSNGFRKLTSKRNIRLRRQLANFREGLKSVNPIDRIRNFHNILEDEGQSPNKYKFVRHLVSHPKLTRKKAVNYVKKIFDRNYIDPSKPSDINKLVHISFEIKDRAKQIINKKLHM